ncbi:hypothetical protein M3J09_002480 [Ascochyta lentis]
MIVMTTTQWTAISCRNQMKTTQDRKATDGKRSGALSAQSIDLRMSPILTLPRLNLDSQATHLFGQKIKDVIRSLLPTTACVRCQSHLAGRQRSRRANSRGKFVERGKCLPGIVMYHTNGPSRCPVHRLALVNMSSVHYRPRDIPSQ